MSSRLRWITPDVIVYQAYANLWYIYLPRFMKYAKGASIMFGVSTVCETFQPYVASDTMTGSHSTLEHVSLSLCLYV